MSITEKIEEFIAPLAEKEGFDIVDVEYVKEDGQKVLRVYIDKEGGVILDDCAKMSNLFGELLDKEDVLKEHYVLEISSPGIDRILKKEKDFIRFKGCKIKVTAANAINGQRNFCGKLLAAGSGKIVIDDLTNKAVEIEISNIIRAKIEPEF